MPKKKDMEDSIREYDRVARSREGKNVEPWVHGLYAGIKGLLKFEKKTKAEKRQIVGDKQFVSERREHLEKHLGSISKIWTDFPPEDILIDVFKFMPTQQHPFQILVTDGMSNRPIITHTDGTPLSLTELVMCLPPDWNFDENESPVTVLKEMAFSAHKKRQAFHENYVDINPDPAGEALFVATLVCLPQLLPAAFHTFKPTSFNPVQYYAVIPLVRKELEFINKNGVQQFVPHAKNKRLTELLDIERTSVL